MASRRIEGSVPFVSAKKFGLHEASQNAFFNTRNAASLFEKISLLYDLYAADVSKAAQVAKGSSILLIPSGQRSPESITAPPALAW